MYGSGLNNNARRDEDETIGRDEPARLPGAVRECGVLTGESRSRPAGQRATAQAGPFMHVRVLPREIDGCMFRHFFFWRVACSVTLTT